MVASGSRGRAAVGGAGLRLSTQRFCSPPVSRKEPCWEVEWHRVGDPTGLLREKEDSQGMGSHRLLRQGLVGSEVAQGPSCPGGTCRDRGMARKEKSRDAARGD